MYVDNAVPVPPLRRAAGQLHAHPVARGQPVRRPCSAGARARAARRARSSRTRPTPNVVYGSCKGQFARHEHAHAARRSNYWVGAQSLYGNAGAGPDLPLPARLADGALAARPERALLRLAVRAPHARQGRHLGDDLPRPHRNSPTAARARSGEPITRDITGEEFYSTLYAIRESPLEQGVIWTGANDGPFHVTRDNGKTWTNITPTDLELGGRVQWIEPSPHRAGSAYYAVLPLPARRLHARTSTGPTTTARRGRCSPTARTASPPTEPTRVVREDPDREGLLYAGTEFGMYISFDNGKQLAVVPAEPAERADQPTSRCTTRTW